MAREKHGCGCGSFLMLVAVVTVGIWFFMSSLIETKRAVDKDVDRRTKERQATEELAKQQVDDEISKFENFTLVGHWDRGDAFQVYTYYVSNPTQADIQAFCDLLKRQKGATGIIHGHFYDRLDVVPDLADEYSFSAESDAHKIAHYVRNPNSGTDRLRFHNAMAD